jgi:hypothetical protein
MQVGDYHGQSDEQANAPQLAEPLGSDGPAVIAGARAHAMATAWLRVQLVTSP